MEELQIMNSLGYSHTSHQLAKKLQMRGEDLSSSGVEMLENIVWLWQGGKKGKKGNKLRVFPVFP